MGVQFGTELSELPGNWGFGEIYSPAFTAPGAISLPMPTGDYLVEVVIPDDPVFGRPLYTGDPRRGPRTSLTATVLSPHPAAGLRRAAAHRRRAGRGRRRL